MAINVEKQCPHCGTMQGLGNTICSNTACNQPLAAMVAESKRINVRNKVIRGVSIAGAGLILVGSIIGFAIMGSKLKKAKPNAVPVDPPRAEEVLEELLTNVDKAYDVLGEEVIRLKDGNLYCKVTLPSKKVGLYNLSEKKIVGGYLYDQITIWSTSVGNYAWVSNDGELGLLHLDTLTYAIPIGKYTSIGKEITIEGQKCLIVYRNDDEELLIGAILAAPPFEEIVPLTPASAYKDGQFASLLATEGDESFTEATTVAASQFTSGTSGGGQSGTQSASGGTGGGAGGEGATQAYTTTTRATTTTGGVVDPNVVTGGIYSDLTKITTNLYRGKNKTTGLFDVIEITGPNSYKDPFSGGGQILWEFDAAGNLIIEFYDEGWEVDPYYSPSRTQYVVGTTVEIRL